MNTLKTGRLWILICLALAGCGGSNVSVYNGPTQAQFAGHYTGSFSRSATGSDSGDSGTLDLTLDTQGNITGTAQESTQSSPHSITGSVDKLGQFQLDLHPLSGTPLGWFGGGLTLSPAGALSGTLTTSPDFGIDIHTQFSLQRQ